MWAIPPAWRLIVPGVFLAGYALALVFWPIDSTAQTTNLSALTSTQVEFFESRIRPALVAHCYDCHTDALKGGLRVDSREALLKGGKRGPAIVPGAPENSLLIQAVSHTHPTLRMPQGAAKLKDDELADLKQWVKDGAVWPVAPVAKAKSDYLIKPEHQTFWSFQPVGRPAVPVVKGAAHNPIDAFLLARLEAQGLTFNPPADRRALLRRVTYDLTGLPPAPAELEAFLADHAPDAFARVVDRLLGSPHYGERWGRHWLDLARYADTLGLVDAGRNLQGWFPYSYTYRDWVIRALNADLPYDQFILQQLAADKLPDNEPRHLAALGFLSLSRGGLGVTRDERLDDKIDVVSRGLLGLTVSCARCHNHKFDPIPTKDYYALYTIFANTREPAELPFLNPRAAATDTKTLELKKENEKIEAEIATLREKRYPELKTLYAAAPEIAKCLLGVYEARLLKTDAELQKFAQEKDYNVYMLKRWREFLQRTGDDEVWMVWHKLAALPEKEFNEKAGAALAVAVAGKINPLVAQAFNQLPGSLREAAEWYGKLLAAYDKPEPLVRADEERLRQVLRADNAPVNVPFSDYEKIYLSTDRQNEQGKRRRLETLMLAHAYQGAAPRAQSVEDVPAPQPGAVFIRGNPANRGEAVQPQFLLILAGEQRKPFTQGSGRLELAQAIASPQNPLTARVLVNRVWLHHFGAGLVRTPSDFGTRGEAPTHPELLDYLARYFVENGWSIKKLHRQILLSRAYQQGSTDNQAARRLDPDNKLLWRVNRRRLDFEELRDSLLTASGKLDRTLGGLPVSAIAWPYTYRRTVYSFIDRALVPNDFRVFDFASPDAHSPQRYLTTVPQQALLMLNSPFVIEQAKAVLQRPEIVAEQNPRRRIQQLYRLLYSRAPNAAEIALGVKFTNDPANGWREADLAEAQQRSAWQYGQGEYDEKADRVKSFDPLDYFINGQWSNSPMPGDPRAPTARLSNKGGMLGDNKSNSAIRRWVAPFTGRVTISGLLAHQFENGCRKCKGAYARVVSNRGGSLGKWEALFNQVETGIASLEVQRGDTLDFVVEAGKGTAGGEFKWAVTIKRLDGQPGEWDSVRNFRQPSAGVLNAWDRYVQALLAAVEFSIID